MRSLGARRSPACPLCLRVRVESVPAAHNRLMLAASYTVDYVWPAAVHAIPWIVLSSGRDRASSTFLPPVAVVSCYACVPLPGLYPALQKWLWHAHIGSAVYSLTIGGVGGIIFKLMLAMYLDGRHTFTGLAIVAPLVVQAALCAGLWLYRTCRTYSVSSHRYVR